MIRYPLQASKLLNPQVQSLKNLAENKLQNKSDFVIFNKSGVGGVTDLTFELYKSKKRVSIYFKMDNAGIESYRKIATKLQDNNSVELSYTPHFGQSRISFEWDEFWNMYDQSQLNFLKNSNILQLQSSSDYTLQID